jgi:hypothetical protein
MDSAVLIQFAALVIGLVVACAALLRAWNGWLELKRLELTVVREQPAGSTGERIALADLKQRVRRLEILAEVIDIPDARRSGI